MRGRWGYRAVVSGAVVAVAMLSGVVPAVATTATTTVVSYAPDGSNADNSSFEPSISSNGRYVAFRSSATNLVTGDTNAKADVFRRDLATGDIVRVSVADDETQADDYSYGLSISADGRYIAFNSRATNMVAGDTNDKSDVFVRDLTAGTTVRVSVADDETQANGDSQGVSISADGRLVAFFSYATNVVAGDTNDKSDVFVRDLTAGTTVRVSVADDETQADDYSSYPSISADGRSVAFWSTATNLVAGDTNDLTDVFVRDLTAGTTVRVSVADDETQANGDSYGPSITADGRHVAFFSLATNLVAGDTNDLTDVFVRDLTAGTTVRVSVADDETQANNASYGSPSISADGRHVAFSSQATNLVSGDTNERLDVFVRNLTSGTTVRVSVNALGVEGNFGSLLPSISADGQRVAFHSAATNLTTITNPPADTCEASDWDAPVFADDRNCRSDVFVHDLAAELPPTGADTDGFVAAAVVLLTAGAVLVATRRRRPISA